MAIAGIARDLEQPHGHLGGISERNNCKGIFFVEGHDANKRVSSTCEFKRLHYHLNSEQLSFVGLSQTPFKPFKNTVYLGLQFLAVVEKAGQKRNKEEKMFGFAPVLPSFNLCSFASGFKVSVTLYNLSYFVLCFACQKGQGFWANSI